MGPKSETRHRWQPGRNALSCVQRNRHLARDLGLPYHPHPQKRTLPW